MKKLVALLLAVSMIFCLAACNSTPAESKKEDQTTTSASAPSGGKIGIFCSPLSWGEENYRTVEKYLKNMGEDRFIVNTIPDDADVQTMISLVSSMAEDPECSVIIVNESIPGTVAALNAAKAINPNLLTFAVNYLEEPIEVSNVCDFACGKSNTDFGHAIVDAAHEKGLDVVVLQAPADTLGTTRVVERIAACEERAKEYNMTFVTTTLPNETDSNGRAPLEQAAKEDVVNKINEYGEKVGFFPCSSYAYVPDMTAICEQKAGYLLCLADPGPFVSAFNDVFGITAPADKAMDLEWTNKAIAEAIEEKGLTGHFGNWAFSFLAGFMGASIEYAVKYQNGELGKNDMNAWLKLFEEVNNLDSGAYTWAPYTREGATYQNIAQVTGKILWYGENLGK